ncbi:MAG: response regulator, partial [Acidobacteriota bacterium]
MTNTDPRSHVGAPHPASVATERILLVDDEEVLRRLARSVLTRQGYEVVDASDPAAAVAIAEAQPESFDLILADVMMPGMRGYEMVRQIRPHQCRAKVLYMS